MRTENPGKGEAMWPMIAESGLRCDECHHNIQQGRLCLSELPEETPTGTPRADFKNYCIGCPQCWTQGKHACYPRHLGETSPSSKAPRSLPCARCGRRIAAGDKASLDRYYEWDEAAEDGGTGRKAQTAGLFGIPVAAVGLDLWIRGAPAGTFEGLSDGLQQKFASAGLRGTERSVAEAQAFYQESIPHPVRNLGEDAVSRFTNGKDASHIQSVENAPLLANETKNIVWEDSGINRARGSENMTEIEQLRVGAGNAFDATGIVLRECLETAAITGFYAGLLEAPVTAIENYLHYARGRKTGEGAIKDAATAIAVRAGAGAAVGFTATIAVAAVGAGPLLMTIAPAMLPVGMALYGYNALKRIQGASAHELPKGLLLVGTYFCSPRCHTKFAYETGLSALMRWEANRIAARR